MYAITKKYGVTKEDLLQWNDMPTTDINIDQKLIVGWKEETNAPQQEFIFHIVQQGESMYSISKKYGVPIPLILQWNNKDTDSLKIEEELKILKR